MYSCLLYTSKRMTLAQRLFSSPDTTPRTGGTIYTIQAIIEDIPLNTRLSFLQKIDMLILNDSEGLIQFDGLDSMTGGLTVSYTHLSCISRGIYYSRSSDLLYHIPIYTRFRSEGIRGYRNICYIVTDSGFHLTGNIILANTQGCEMCIRDRGKPPS